MERVLLIERAVLARAADCLGTEVYTPSSPEDDLADINIGVFNGNLHPESCPCEM